MIFDSGPVVVLVYALVAAVLAYFGTVAVRTAALRTGMLDIPNSRSSHENPVPRGGGLAIVAAVLLCIGLLGATGHLGGPLLILFFAGGGTVAFVGYLDDRRGLSAATRFVVHLVCGVVAVYIAGDLPPQQIGHGVVDLGALSFVLALLAVVWMLNLFNFMDGIDGIAASEAIFVCGSGAWLAAGNGAPTWLVVALAVMAGACVGFLVLNWAPAKIFMGDAGSGFIGFMIAAFALAALNEGGMSLWTWLILSSLFLADASATLVRRIARGENPATAHRMHAYQWLSRRWSSHSKVTLLYSAINLTVLLPVALMSVRYPQHAAALAAAAFTTAVLFSLASGAGRAEDS